MTVKNLRPAPRRHAPRVGHGLPDDLLMTRDAHRQTRANRQADLAAAVGKFVGGVDGLS